MKSKQARAEVLARLITAAPIQVNMKALARHMGAISRRQLRANGIDPKVLTGPECFALATEQMRAFLGLDRSTTRRR